MLVGLLERQLGWIDLSSLLEECGSVPPLFAELEAQPATDTTCHELLPHPKEGSRGGAQGYIRNVTFPRQVTSKVPFPQKKQFKAEFCGDALKITLSKSLSIDVLFR
eukprot:2697453-Amphidinium_carterae.1